MAGRGCSNCPQKGERVGAPLWLIELSTRDTAAGAAFIVSNVSVLQASVVLAERLWDFAGERAVVKENGLINEFVSHCEVERHLSPRTVRCYSADLHQFCAFLAREMAELHQFCSVIRRKASDSGDGEHLGGYDGAGDAHPSESHEGTQVSTAVRDPMDMEQRLFQIEADDIREFLTHLRGQGYSESTTARKLAVLRSFYKFCLRRGYLQSSPLASIRTPKREKRLPTFLEIDQINKLLNTPNDSTLVGARDKAMFELLCSTGIRASEMVDLNRADIDEDAQCIRVRRTNSRERTAPVGPTVLGAVRRYLAMRDADPRFAESDREALFVNKDGHRLSTRSVCRKLDKYLDELGLDLTASPRTLRHSFAIHMLNNGMGLSDVQDLLGHRSISTTKVYAHVASAQLKSTWDSAHSRR